MGDAAGTVGVSACSGEGGTGSPRFASLNYRPVPPFAPLGLENMRPNRSPLRSFSELGDAVGQDRAKHGLIDRRLDEVSATKRRSDREHLDRPFTATPTGRALFARYDILQKLAAYIDCPEAPPSAASAASAYPSCRARGLGLAAVDALINTIVAGWGLE
jgi:hypothetical protein